MSFEIYFAEQLNNHPSMQFEDVIKLCYQAAFGAEHLITDTEAAKNYLFAEFNSVTPTNEPIFEMISDDFCRVNLGAWKRENKSIETLFDIFVQSAKFDKSTDKFFSYLNSAEQVLKEKSPYFDAQKWQNFREEYIRLGMPAIRHSSDYRGCENPSYRIVKIKELEDIL